MPSLPSEDVKQRLAQEAARVEAWLSRALRREGVPEGLVEAMEYSLNAGGKRLRPVLCLLSARMCGADDETLLPFAGALECIHTYSLIHDDLPAMDDDDLRRGKPSNHKVYGEAAAILAGDGLLTDAFVFMSTVAGAVPAARVLEAVALVAVASGSSGMVGGQYLDMEYTGMRGLQTDRLAAMQAMKTGALIRVACESGAVLAGAPKGTRQALAAYGTALGAAFQISDDILDATGSQESLGKPVGSDEAKDKNTWISLFGLEQSRALASGQARAAASALEPWDCPAARLLKGLAGYVVNRVS